MLPVFVIWVLAILGGGVLGAIIGISYEEIVKFFSQKRISILGERRVGKTMLFNYLSKGIIHTKYYATTHSITVKGRSFSLNDLNLVIADSLDVTGNPDGMIEWEKSYKKADYVLYIFRADLVFPSSLKDVIYNFKNNRKVDSDKFTQFIGVFNGYLDAKHPKLKKIKKNSSADTIQELSQSYADCRDSYIKRFRADVQQINKWQKSKEKPIVFIGTHGDFIPKFDYLNMLKRGDIYDTFRNELYEKIPELSAIDRQNIVVGAFTNDDEFQYYLAMVFRLLKDRAKEISAKKTTEQQKGILNDKNNEVNEL